MLGGAFLVHPGPDGQIEELSPEEAAKRPEIAASGRLVPDTLTRRVHDAYALRGGIWNYLFLHTNQTKIVDTELNRQPYLLVLENRAGRLDVGRELLAEGVAVGIAVDPAAVGERLLPGLRTAPSSRCRR